METYFIKNFDGSDVFIVDNNNTDASITVLLLHGSNMNSDIFKHQFESELLQKYRLVAINLPGNGKSPKAKQPEKVYPFKGLVKTIDHCFSELKIPNKTYVVGHSLGAHLITNNTKSPSLFSGAFCLGYPPLHEVGDFANATEPIPSLQLLFTETLTEADIIQIADDVMSGKKSDIDIKSIIRSVDPEFRKIYGSSVADGLVTDEFETIEKFKNPFAIIHCEKDRFIKHGYFKESVASNLWRSGTQVLKNASHIPFIDEASSFNKLLDEYIVETS